MSLSQQGKAKLKLVIYMVFLSPISGILAIGMFLQTLYLVVINKQYSLLQLGYTMLMTFYFMFMTFLSLDTMFKLMQEVFGNAKKD